MVRELAAGLDRPVILPCDVSKDEDLETLAASVKSELGGWTSWCMRWPTRCARSWTASS
jgi:enoyl-[acyl-carrier-protein] reductase (NADH)